MALIEISETQLAFGYLHSYMKVYEPKHFMIPSLRQEGGKNNFRYRGADVILNRNHLIQFKRPFYFTTNGIKEFQKNVKPTDLDPPYFRFYIKNDDPTNQLSKLVQATQYGLFAEYISPLFANETEFFNLMKNDQRHLNAYVHIDISQFSGMLETIGNNNDHTIIYNPKSVDQGFCYCFSEPKKIKAERYEDISRNKRKDESFTAFRIVNLIRSIFFQEQDFPFKSDDALYQCQVLQFRLFVQRDIIWHFNYTIR